jgi:hypothetical protein
MGCSQTARMDPSRGRADGDAFALGALKPFIAGE